MCNVNQRINAQQAPVNSYREGLDPKSFFDRRARSDSYLPVPNAQ